MQTHAHTPTNQSKLIYMRMLVFVCNWKIVDALVHTRTLDLNYSCMLWNKARAFTGPIICNEYKNKHTLITTFKSKYINTSITLTCTWHVCINFWIKTNVKNTPRKELQCELYMYIVYMTIFTVPYVNKCAGVRSCLRLYLRTMLLEHYCLHLT